MFQKTLLAFLVVLISSTLAFATEMVAFKALGDQYFRYQIGNHVGPYDVQEMLLYYQYLGNPGLFEHEIWGMGFAYHEERNSHTEPGFIVTGSSMTSSDIRFAANYTYSYPAFFGNGDAFIPDMRHLTIFGETVSYDFIGTVFLHKRDYMSPNLMSVDPQPFVYRGGTGNRSYSFMHEGTFSQDQLIKLMHFYILHPNLVDPEITSLMLGTDYSGHLFAYILLKIREQNMDILRGIHSAVESLVVPNGPNPDYAPHNFIFSDGFDLYVFKFGNENLRIYRDDEREVTLVTSHNLVQPDARDHLARVFTDDDLVYLPYGSLVYLPFHGRPVRFENFVYSSVVKMTRRINPGDFNWLGYPVLPQVLPPDTLRITELINSGLDDIIWISLEDGGSTLYYPVGSSWVDSPSGFDNVADPTLAIKIRYFDTAVDSVYTTGYLGPIWTNKTLVSPVASSTYHSGRWVPYNIASSQSLKDALGDNPGRIWKVKSDNWAWDANLPSHYVMAQKPMEFGKMYEIYFDNQIDFDWFDVRTRSGSIAFNEPALGKLNRKSQHFAYTTQDNYEAIDIMSLSLYQDDCVEIGAFAGDICVGAVRVDEFPVQVLVYTLGFDGTPLTFKVLLNNNRVMDVKPMAEIYKVDKADYDADYLIAGEFDHTAVRLNINSDDANVKVPAKITNHQVYPNPFNPSTTISFSITENSLVSVEIYNIRGQKVKTLLNESLPTGKHTIQWNGFDESKRQASSGIYFYRIKTENHRITGKMILMK